MYLHIINKFLKKKRKERKKENTKQKNKRESIHPDKMIASLSTLQQVAS
jgi:hypothetical protein